MVTPVSALGTPAQALDYTEGAKDDLSNLTAPTAINQDLLPAVTATYSLGSAAFLWGPIYTVGVLTGEDVGDSFDLTAFNTNTMVQTTMMRFEAGNPPLAEIRSPVTAVTQAPGTNTDQLSTCAFVQAAVTAGAGVPTARTITIDGTANEIASSAGAQDLSANRTWTLSLPAAMTFTGKTITGGTFDAGTATNFTYTTGSIGTAVTAVTQALATNTTQVATCAFVLANAGGGGTSYVNQNSSSVTMAANTIYGCNNGASLITFTLPAVATAGQIFEIVGNSAGGWTLVYGAGQSIRYGNIITTTTTGSLSSSNRGDCISIICIVANTTFSVRTGSIGNITWI